MDQKNAELMSKDKLLLLSIKDSELFDSKIPHTASVHQKSLYSPKDTFHNPPQEKYLIEQKISKKCRLL